MPKQPEHLGDGVYISPLPYNGAFILTANHHDPSIASDKIVLEDFVIEALLRYLEIPVPSKRP